MRTVCSILSSLALGMGDFLDQGSANCGLWADSPSVFVNKALLEHSCPSFTGTSVGQRWTFTTQERPADLVLGGRASIA